MMPISKYLATLSVGACFVSSVIAGTDYQPPATPPPSETPMPTFRVEDLEPRKSPSGLNVAIFGGASIAQEEDASIGSGPVANQTYHPKDVIGGVGGIKIGYTWDPALNSNYVDEGGVKLMPAIEAEAFYLGWDTDGSVNAAPGGFPAGTRASTTIDAAVFSINGLMKFEIFERFRPYIGMGIGFAYLNSSNGSLTAPPAGLSNADDTDVVLAAQGIAGLEVCLTENWALFGEYKFLYLNDASFSYSTTPAGGYNEDYNYIGHNIVSAGVRYYFY